MVELKGRKYGLDLNGSIVFFAGRTFAAGKEVIDILTQTDLSKLSRDTLGEDGETYFSVSEKEAVIKLIKISPSDGLDSEKLALFELQTSLLEEADHYYYEIGGLDTRSERLAVAYPRSIIDSKIAQIENLIPRPRGFRLRTLALAAGFLHFCHHEGGELVCLIDIGSDQIAYCYLYNRRPIAAGCISYKNADESEGPFLPHDALLDLTATLQYQSSLLFQSGFSVPLSLIVISGSKAGEELATRIEKNTRVKTILPSIKKEMFTSEVLAAAPRYLVSIGLTVGL